MLSAFQSPHSYIGCSRTHLCTTLFLSTISSTKAAVLATQHRLTSQANPVKCYHSCMQSPLSPGAGSLPPWSRRGAETLLSLTDRQTDTTTKSNPRTLPESCFSYSQRWRQPAELHVTSCPRAGADQHYPMGRQPPLGCDTQPTPAMGERHSP